MPPWHPRVMQRFDRIPADPQESDFYGPYNTLLHVDSLFPAADAEFAVGPRCPESNSNVDSLVEFVVFYERRPVFVLQINNPARVTSAAARGIAHFRMRRILEELSPSCPLPTLEGVSTFGTSLGFYSFNHQNLKFSLPFAVEGDNDADADPPPQARWNSNVLEESGADKLNTLVGQIKEACRKIKIP